MTVVRYGMRTLADLVRFSVRSGRLWIIVPVLVLVAVAALIAAAHAIVPTTIYVVF